MGNMHISAEISGIKYNPTLCKNLEVFNCMSLKRTLATYASFILNMGKGNKVAISWWVSAKRTRSYPYARVYDTLGFAGKKITIIPIVKDEGKEGDRDFLQWDTISLMSLLGVYVIIAYYSEAERSGRYKQKITKQRFDVDYIKEKLEKILTYHSDALHWNLEQVDSIGEIGVKALKAYDKIAQDLGVEMHSRQSAQKRITEIAKGRKNFMTLSRIGAKSAQYRESKTTQPKEKVAGKKAAITIKNYLGGYYYFTADETEVRESRIYLIEAKHSATNTLPSLDDIKDGLVKMILFTNLENVKVEDKYQEPVAVLKLTTKSGFATGALSLSQRKVFDLLKKEASINNFEIRTM